MAIQIKHAFTSLKGDGGDATLVRPSNWNADHTTSMASGKLLGRLTAGTGVFEEITISALVAGALDETTGAAFLAALGVGAFETGDVKFTINTASSTGWVSVGTATVTIGKVGSGATYAATDAQALYEMCYTNISDAGCPVSGGRTGNATNDFNAGKTLQLPSFPGRSVIGSGTGSGLSARTLGIGGGAETHPLTVAELASHYHVAAISDSGHAHGYIFATSGAGISSGSGFVNSTGGTTGTSTTGVRVNSANGLDTTASTGSGTAHNNMSPFIPLLYKVKL